MIDTSMVRLIACPTLLAASSFLFSPSFSDKLAAAPFQINPARALNIITNGNITFVAAFPRVPTPLPIKI